MESTGPTESAEAGGRWIQSTQSVQSVQSVQVCSARMAVQWKSMSAGITLHLLKAPPTVKPEPTAPFSEKREVPPDTAITMTQGQLLQLLASVKQEKEEKRHEERKKKTRKSKESEPGNQKAVQEPLRGRGSKLRRGRAQRARSTPAL